MSPTPKLWLGSAHIQPLLLLLLVSHRALPRYSTPPETGFKLSKDFMLLLTIKVPGVKIQPPQLQSLWWKPVTTAVPQSDPLETCAGLGSLDSWKLFRQDTVRKCFSVQDSQYNNATPYISRGWSYASRGFVGENWNGEEVRSIQLSAQDARTKETWSSRLPFIASSLLWWEALVGTVPGTEPDTKTQSQASQRLGKHFLSFPSCSVSEFLFSSSNKGLHSQMTYCAQTLARFKALCWVQPHQKSTGYRPHVLTSQVLQPRLIPKFCW